MNESKQKILIESVICRPREQDTEITKIKEQAIENSKRSDWLWHLLLSSMATMGNSRGYKGLIENEEHYNLASYEALLKLEPEIRLTNIQSALKKGTVRRHNSKGRWLAKNFLFIQDCGGIEVLQNILLNTRGRDSKIHIMKLFDGIGHKYARNIFMDIYHEDFIDSIAVDERLSNILDKLEVDLNLSYSEKENIFVQIAIACQISPWQLDRLLYIFNPYYIAKLKKLD